MELLRDLFALNNLACEQAPNEVGKKFGWQSEWESSVVSPGAKQVGSTPSSPDRSRLVPLALDYTPLTQPGACLQAMNNLKFWGNFAVFFRSVA